MKKVVGLPVVVNLRKEAYTKYIGRGSIWGNPFKIGVHGTREDVIAKYESHVRRSPELILKLPELYGHRLGCYCNPKECHGDVLVKLCKEIWGMEIVREWENER